MSKIPHILIVDDEPFNIQIVQELLEEEGSYRLSSAEDGDVALAMMEATPEDFDIILLDRMMPNMNGMVVLLKMQQHAILKHCLVVFQTAKSSVKDISEGIEAGAYYYLTKPFNEEVLLAVIKTAVRDRQRYKDMLTRLNANKMLMGLLKTANFEFKTLNEARSLSTLLCNAFPEPEKVVMGLTELMLNAVEHGNLGVTYDEKSVLNSTGKWEEERERRLTLDKYSGRRASVEFQLKNDEIEITVKDQGAGFDWKEYMNFEPRRVMDNHGRGIAIANKLCFSSVEYRGNGNEVCARLKVVT